MTCRSVCVPAFGRIIPGQASGQDRQSPDVESGGLFRTLPWSLASGADSPRFRLFRHRRPRVPGPGLRTASRCRERPPRSNLHGSAPSYPGSPARTARRGNARPPPVGSEYDSTMCAMPALGPDSSRQAASCSALPVLIRGRRVRAHAAPILSSWPSRPAAGCGQQPARRAIASASAADGRLMRVMPVLLASVLPFRGVRENYPVPDSLFYGVSASCPQRTARSRNGETTAAGESADPQRNPEHRAARLSSCCCRGLTGRRRQSG